MAMFALPHVPEQYVIFQVGMIPSKYYKVLGDKDLTEFRNLTLIASLIIISMAFVSILCYVFFNVILVAAVYDSTCSKL